MIYRLLLTHADMGLPPGAGGENVESGATYAGCSIDNRAVCQPKSFLSMADGITYSIGHGEIPYQVHSEAEAWGITNGSIPIDESRVLTQPLGTFNFATVAVLAGVGFWLWKRKKT